jgi:hypothetical protein
VLSFASPLELIMFSIRSIRLGTLAAIVALAGACSDSTGPSVVQPADLSEVLGELQPSALPGITADLSVVPATELSAPTPSSCSYDSATKSFLCPDVSLTGVTVTRSFTLYDASDNPQTAFDKTTTAAVRLKTTFAGTLTTAGSTVAIDQQQDVKLSGLLSGVHTLNGSSLGHIKGTEGTGTAATPVDVTIATTINNLMVPRASASNRWPKSGSISATVTDATIAAPFSTAAITITFNGTSKATVTVTVGGVTSTSTVDLSNG